MTEMRLTCMTGIRAVIFIGLIGVTRNAFVFTIMCLMFLIVGYIGHRKAKMRFLLEHISTKGHP